MPIPAFDVPNAAPTARNIGLSQSDPKYVPGSHSLLNIIWESTIEQDDQWDAWGSLVLTADATPANPKNGA